MPFGSVQLIPGVNVERTPMLLRAGYSSSALIRYRDGLAQKLGGWTRFYPFQVSGIPRALHGWQDLNDNNRLAVGTTKQLGVVTNGSYVDVTPQELVSDFAPNFSTTNGSPVVEIKDPNIANVTTFDSVFFNVPVSVGGLILDGLYAIASVTGTSSYTIVASSNASFTQSGATATNGATAAGDPTLNFAATPSWVVAKMVVANATTPASIPAGTLVDSTTATTAVMTANAAAPGVGNGDEIIFCSLPVFTTTSGTSAVSVFLVGHGVSAGGTVVFAVSTSGNGVTIGGSYTVLSVVDANNFVIQANTEASASGSFVMNNGNAQLVYSITLGPLPAGTGYGLGLYGAGAYGFGTASSSVQTGTTITATDWTIDNWGKLVIACPKGGPIYYWDPQGGFLNASVISSGPPFNSGIFVSMSQQILVAYGSSVEEDLGHQHQHMLVQWSTVGDFLDWTPRAGNQAGNFVIPIGSRIVAGLPGANQNLIWTDLDLWAMNYIGPPNVFGFNKIGAGAGAVSAHAVQQLRGSTFWMGRTNFYAYTAGGVNTLPCPIWDVVFQNLNTDFLQNVRAMPNTPFNEVGWLYPSAASTSGECDSYVKMNITEQGAPWDYGPLSRSAWIDQTILGMPIGASPQGFIYQHESGTNADGAPLTSTFTTGDFYLAEGEDFVFVDQIIPDFKWTTYTGTTSAAVQLTFLVSDFPGDNPRTFGPYTVTSATKFITVRFRGRLMRVVVASSDLNSFWRLGTIKYRYGPAVGRR